MLSTIHDISAIRNLDFKELRILASEIRAKIIDVVGKNGGHLSSNLGVVELTLALHRVFTTPEDAIIWDVGHQCYTHKIITGRYTEFDTLRQHEGVSGFPKHEESVHDFFNTGHASTSISSALGLLTAKRLRGESGKVVAVIGDGSLTGGLAVEALNNAGQLMKDLIVVVNDNKMSIGVNNSAISKYLSKFTMSITYQLFRKTVDAGIAKIPFLDKYLTLFIYRFKRSLKGLFFKENLFADFGFEYVGPIDGHNIAEMESIFKKVKKIQRPVVVHVLTKKGKGYSFAENDPATFHGIGPFNLTDGKVEQIDAKSFTQVFSEITTELGEKDPSIVAITAAMAKGTGLSLFQHRFPDRCFDVGIAEEHAVTFAGGLAAGGLKPLVAIYSTFMQRAVDQVIHDIALQHFPVVFTLDRSGVVPDEGETHQGLFDISLFSCIPGITILSPATETELRMMLPYAFSLAAPVFIRYPKASCPVDLPEFASSIQLGRGILVSCSTLLAESVKPRTDRALATGSELFDPSVSDNSHGEASYSYTNEKELSDILIVCTGGVYPEASAAAVILSAESIAADIYNLRFIKPIDTDYFVQICSRYRAVIFVEDGIRTGGVSERLEKLLWKQLPGVQTTIFAFEESFYKQGKRLEIFSDAGLSPSDIAVAAKKLI